MICIDEEIPFEIPESWEWCRLSNLVQINPKNYVEDDTDAAFIPMEKIDATYLSNFTYSVRKWKEIKSGFTHFADGDVAFAKITPCFQNRKSMILKALPNGIGAGTTELKVLRTYGETLSKEYLLFFLESPYFVEEAKFKGTANQQRIISGYLEEKLFPIPPMEEQKRVVEKILNSFAIVEKYSKAQEMLDNLNKNISPLLRKSILQEAIQGHLVPQDPNDEPASVLLQRIKEEKLRLVKEGKLKKKDVVDSVIYKGDDNRYFEKIGKNITDITDEIPFDVPDSWVWTRLKHICTKFVDGDHNPPVGTSNKTNFLMLSSRNINNNTLVDLDKVRYLTQDVFNKENERTNAEKGDILFTSVGTLGRSCIFDGSHNICFQRSVSVIRTMIFNRYLKYFLDNPHTQDYIFSHATGTAQKGFYLNQLADVLVSIPPLCEQQRIVNQIEKIFSEIKGN